MSGYLKAETSAINESWVCLGSNGTDCFFLNFQQFNRSSPLAAKLECTLFFILASTIVPANSWAIVRFKRKGINEEFGILVVALCTYNFFNSFVYMINGLARTSQYHYPLGHFGCFISTCFSCIINNATTMTLALISCERRSLVMRRTEAQPSSRSTRIAGMVVLIFTICTIFWASFFIGFDVFEVVKVSVHNNNNNNNNHLSQVCLARPDRGILPAHIVVGITSLLIPFLIIAYNYM